MFLYIIMSTFGMPKSDIGHVLYTDPLSSLSLFPGHSCKHLACCLFPFLSCSRASFIVACNRLQPMKTFHACLHCFSLRLRTDSRVRYTCRKGLRDMVGRSLGSRSTLDNASRLHHIVVNCMVHRVALASVFAGTSSAYAASFDRNSVSSCS